MPFLDFYRRHRRKILGGILGLCVLFGLIFLFSRPRAPEYVTATAVRGDLVRTVEAVGTVISEKDLELQFSSLGIVAAVLVKEGDAVRAGQRLATLRAGNRAAMIASAAAGVQSAQAALTALQEGTRPEEITIAEAEVANRRAMLEAAKTNLATAEESVRTSRENLKFLEDEARVSLIGEVEVARASLQTQLTTAENGLSVIDDVLNNVIVQDAILKDRPAEYNGLRQQRNAAQESITAARSKASVSMDAKEIAIALELGRAAMNSVTLVLDRTFDALNATPEIGNYNAAEKERQKAKISAQRAHVQTAAGNVQQTAANFRNAFTNFETRIAAEEGSLKASEGTADRAKSDILNSETQLRMQEAQLALKKAGPRKTDIDAAAARVRQARADVARAQADFSDTVLVSPVDGIVTAVAIKPGQYTPSGPAVTVLGSVPYRVEMFVSEIDIPKVQLSQSGSIELDAFRGTAMKLHVGEIDPAATDKEGVSKYRVKLDFVHLHPELKVGMTGDAEIVTGERSDVVTVPLRAVLENAEGKDIVRVLKEDGEVEERLVETGMEGTGGDIEVTGIEEGEVVIVLEKK